MSRVRFPRPFLCVFSLLFLLVIIVFCFHSSESCDDKNQEFVLENDIVSISPSNEKELVEFAVDYDANDVDTLMFGAYVFVSEAIPQSVFERMQNVSLPENAKINLDDLRYLLLPYYDFDGQVKIGEMVCNRLIAKDLLMIFRRLFEIGYQFCSIRLIDDFGASDDASMQANNTSCFNYRMKSGSNELSIHAKGMAVDVNPLQNPLVKRGKTYPSTSSPYIDRNAVFEHKIDVNDACFRVFRSHGFSWGGNWCSAKDYQHFEKR